MLVAFAFPNKMMSSDMYLYLVNVLDKHIGSCYRDLKILS